MNITTLYFSLCFTDFPLEDIWYLPKQRVVQSLSANLADILC